MAKKARPRTTAQRERQRKREVKSGELPDESLEDQLRADAQSDAIDVLDLEPTVPEERTPPKGAGFRPSDLERMIKEWGRKEGLTDDQVAQIDRCRFIRDNGLPNPTRLYRVTGRRGTKEGPVDYGPVKVEATDEADAILRAADQLKISYRIRHRVNFTTVCLQE